jgi:hypothetical protein
VKPRRFWISLTSAFVLGLLSMATQARDLKVNCDIGQSLQDAINRARSSAAPLVVNVKGDCYENVILARDALTIDGGGEAVIHGTVVNRGVRVTLSNLEITRPGFGMRASTGRTRLINVHFFDNEEEGLIIRRNGVVIFSDGSVESNDLEGVVVESATLIADDVEISANRTGIAASMAQITLEDTQVVNNAERGIDVAGNSALIMSGGTVSGNGGVGVTADNTSSFAADGVDISWNGSTGISVRWNSNADIVGCTIGNNAQANANRSGVFVSTSSSVTIDSTEIFGSGTGVGATRQSFINMAGTTVVRDNLSDGMRLTFDSGAVVDDPVIIPPNGSGYAVYCNDTESSFENRSAGVGPSNCKGFDLP